MRVTLNIFTILGSFFTLLATAYSIWALITYGRVEWVGTIGLALVAVMSFFISFYLRRSFRAQGGALPEDRSDASIDDGDPELGFFSPFSWWPLLLATSAALAFLGMAVGVWIVFIAFAMFVIVIAGWSFEYYRGHHAR